MRALLMSGSLLEARFDQEMRDIYMRAKTECGYNASRYLQMLSEHGGLETARILVRSPNMSDGFIALWQCKRLDLTVEALVSKPEYAGLFDEAVIRAARDRLRALGQSV